MTKKDYIKFAEAFADESHAIAAADDETTPWDVWQSMLTRITSILASDNERFDRARFLAACEGKE